MVRGLKKSTCHVLYIAGGLIVLPLSVSSQWWLFLRSAEIPLGGVVVQSETLHAAAFLSLRAG